MAYPEYNYGGREVIDEDPYESASAYYEYNAKAYTEVSSGTIKMGYINGGSRLSTYTFSPSASGQYLGLAINANRIVLMSQSGDTSHFEVIINGNYMWSGYLQAMTYVEESQSNGVKWRIDRIPFLNGLCVTGR